MYVFRLEEEEYPKTQVSFLARPCQHCDNAPCVKVCPVGARFKREDGIVLTDFQRCIGCRYCEVACPYGVNNFNWKDPSESYYGDWKDPAVQNVTGGAIPPWRNPDLQIVQGEEQRLTAGGGHYKGVVEKCTFCVQRVDKGLDPACVAGCPLNALIFGDRDDPESPVSQYLKRDHFRLLEDAGTEPSVFYVGGNEPEAEVKEIERIRVEVSA
ncbi:MAG: 4Fe-4S dicluster domain-containing protein, partial [Actinobacteria bacterium]|nr:4Fe-4S dicluster domain-containing protein [Actinomycetota bacterium]